jgi:hypothetical protein
VLFRSTFIWNYHTKFKSHKMRRISLYTPWIKNVSWKDVSTNNTAVEYSYATGATFPSCLSFSLFYFLPLFLRGKVVFLGKIFLYQFVKSYFILKQSYPHCSVAEYISLVHDLQPISSGYLTTPFEVRKFQSRTTYEDKLKC